MRIDFSAVGGHIAYLIGQSAVQCHELPLYRVTSATGGRLCRVIFLLLFKSVIWLIWSGRTMEGLDLCVRGREE